MNAKAKSINFYLFLIISISFISTKTFSQNENLARYLVTAAENNPEVKASFYDYLASVEKIPQVGSLPDPELSLGFFLQPMDRLMGRQQADIRLMQMFPWFGMLRTRKDEAGKMAQANYELFQDAKNNLFFEVKNTWYQMYRLEEEIRITEENLKILQTLEQLALVRFQSAGVSSSPGNMPGSSSMGNNSQGATSASSMGNMGSGMNTGKSAGPASSGNPSSMGPLGASMGSGKSGMSDVLRIRMEIKELENRLARLNDDRIPLQAEFNQLLNRNLSEPVEIADTLTNKALFTEHMALLDSITQNNPMLKMLDAEEAAYEAQMKMARLEGKPMLGAGVNYMPFSPRTEDGMSMGGKDMVMPMVSLTIPIYRKKYDALYKEAELKQQAVKFRRENTVNQLATQWSQSIRDLEDAGRRTDLYREQTGLAEQTLNLLMTNYSSDGGGFEEVLRVQQQLLDYRLKLITAVVDQHTAVALLENLAASDGLMER
ncbi:TolC family protein [Gaoshiqia sp. Z1-71]|uniref:TolC family protein n=1 Tax=Gaoshiqia hydrogeniformans TaxID=3290090 RepID=UPI003BF8C78A